MKQMAIHDPVITGGEAPIYTAILETRQKLASSFHALPISTGEAIKGSSLETMFRAAGLHPPVAEISTAAPMFDSLCHATGCIADAEKLAANTFGADGTLFGTCGTTLSNKIVIDAVAKRPGLRVLADKELHQSLHFEMRSHGLKVTYVEPDLICDISERYAFSLQVACKQLAAAEAESDPFHIVVLTGQTYEGVMLDMRKVLPALRKAGPSLKYILVDEAWGAWSYFHEDIRPMTAIAAARNLDDSDGLTVIATQSAHKSLSALRQASLIHYVGDREFEECLIKARYQAHTTSPSSSILVSIDLARLQMEKEGAKLTARSAALAQKVRKKICTEDRLDGYRVIEPSLSDRQCADYIFQDPTKLCVSSRALHISARELRRRLWQDAGVYISRFSEDVVVFNFHIGVQQKDTTRLLDALASIQASCKRRTLNEPSDSYIIPYPPGVPIVVPGESITDALRARLYRAERAGAKLITFHPK